MLNTKPLLGELIDWGNPLSKDLDAVFLMNEGAGSIYDIGPNFCQGTLASGTSWSGNEGIDFNGTTGYIDVGACLRYTSENFTVFVKFIQNAADTEFIIGNAKFNDYGWWISVLNTGSYVFRSHQLPTSQQVVAGGVFTAPELMTMTFTRNGSTGLWYKNGTLLDPSTYVINESIIDPNVSSATTKIGTNYDASSSFLNGKIYYIYVWKRALTASEISAVYTDPYCFVRSRKNRIGLLAEVPAAGVVNLAGQADSTSSATAGIYRTRSFGAQADSASSTAAGIFRTRYFGAAASSASNTTAGFYRTRYLGAQADSISTATAGMIWSLGGIAVSASSTAAGIYRDRRLGALASSVSSTGAGIWRNRFFGAQANSVTATYAGMTGGTAISAEEIFRNRRFRLSSEFARRQLKGVF